MIDSPSSSVTVSLPSGSRPPLSLSVTWLAPIVSHHELLRVGRDGVALAGHDGLAGDVEVGLEGPRVLHRRAGARVGGARRRRSAAGGGSPGTATSGSLLIGVSAGTVAPVPASEPELAVVVDLLGERVVRRAEAVVAGEGLAEARRCRPSRVMPSAAIAREADWSAPTPEATGSEASGRRHVALGGRSVAPSAAASGEQERRGRDRGGRHEVAADHCEPPEGVAVVWAVPVAVPVAGAATAVAGVAAVALAAPPGTLEKATILIVATTLSSSFSGPDVLRLALVEGQVDRGGGEEAAAHDRTVLLVHRDLAVEPVEEVVGVEEAAGHPDLELGPADRRRSR